MRLAVQSPSTNALISGSSVPIDQKGLVHIWGRNDMPTSEKLGIRWWVKDPDGLEVQDYSDWEWGGTGPGAEHEFLAPRFDFDKPGMWKIVVFLFLAIDGDTNRPALLDTYDGDLCAVTTEIPPEYKLIQHTIYPWAYTFEGDAEVCTFEFKLTPEQIPGTEWLGERIVNTFVSELEKEGSKLLELEVYEDTTPILWTNYRVKVTAIASPIAWTPIIVGVLAILFIVAIYFTIKLVDEVFFKRKALPEETKKEFGRETLIAMILDLEPGTPLESLEQASDQELRDCLNAILAEKAPPISWWPLVAVGGAIALIIGVAAKVKPKT